MKTNSDNTIKGIHYRTNEPIKITWQGKEILRVEKLEKCEQDLPTIAPGFIDLQVNGYKGMDFNYKPLTPEEWKNIILSLAEVGVTEFLPTFITNSLEQLEANIAAAERALEQLGEYASFVRGYHLEGPYLSMEDGPRGAHDARYVKAPDWDEFSRLQEAANGKIKLLTISPEWEESEAFIKKAVDSGVKVAIGHTAANTDQIEKAAASGASLSTHLGNGAHVQLPRHPNYIWDQLAQDNLYASVIADGHHLPKNVLKVFQKVKREKMFLISDSVALAGMPPGDYETAVGGQVTLTEDGRLHLKNEPRLLAGSAKNIWQGVQYLAEENICSFPEAIEKASIIPRRFIGDSAYNDFTAGASATMVVINRKTRTIEQTIKEGKIFYKAGDENG